MVYTVTCNPAVDYVVQLDHFEYGVLNRSQREEVQCGGKGINVSVILNELGVKNKALGFAAGFTGTHVEEELARKGVDTDFIRLESGMTRINIKLKGAQETEINASGPQIAQNDLEKMSIKLDAIAEKDVLILSGSLPCGVPEDLYAEWMNRLCKKDIRIVVDASGNLLQKTLKHHPFLIKPNLQELCGLFGRKIASDAEILDCAADLQKQGAQNVLVSLGGDGALLLCETGACWRVNAARGTAANTVGAGDSMVAGFVAGFLESGDYCRALNLGAAAGSATAFSSALASKEEIRRYEQECLPFEVCLCAGAQDGDHGGN